MSSRDKNVLLVAAGAVVVTLIVIAGVAAAWLSFNFDEIREAGSVLQEEGEALGPRTDQPGCLAAALEKLDAAAGLTGEIAVHVFLNACLQSASPAEGFCSDVPSFDRVLDSATWHMERCRQLGRERDQSCTRLMGVVQKFCDQQSGSP